MMSPSIGVGSDRHYGWAALSYPSGIASLRISGQRLQPCKRKREFKSRKADVHLGRLRGFIQDCVEEIPAVVEDVTIVSVHADMGLHSLIVTV